MSEAYLSGNKDVDCLIAHHLIKRGSPPFARTMNALMILFRSYPGFLKGCLNRYMYMLTRYMLAKSPLMIFQRPCYKLNKSMFWRGVVQKFSSGEKVTFTDNHKGHTRLKLYILGLMFGYNHVGYDKEEVEWRCRRGHNLFSENRLVKDKYTMAELVKIRMNLPGMWKETGEKDAKGRAYYKQASYEETGQVWAKRGIMVRRYGRMEFTKVVWTGNETETAATLLAELTTA